MLSSRRRTCRELAGPVRSTSLNWIGELNARRTCWPSRTAKASPAASSTRPTVWTCAQALEPSITRQIAMEARVILWMRFIGSGLPLLELVAKLQCYQVALELVQREIGCVVVIRIFRPHAPIAINGIADGGVERVVLVLAHLA